MPLRLHPSSFNNRRKEAIQSRLDDARLRLLRIADDAGFVQFLRRHDGDAAHLFRGGKACLAVCSNLAPLLRRVVFIGKAALRRGFDLQRVGLGAMYLGDQFVVGALGLGEPGRARYARLNTA